MAEYYGNICTCRKCNGIVHTIRRGDTLYLLSRHYNVTINEIMRANANVNVYNLQVGDQICIPVRRPTPTPPNILGQLLNQNQGQGQMQGRMQNVQSEEERTRDMNNMGMNNMGMSNMGMNENMMSEGESDLEYMETSASESADVEEVVETEASETVETSAQCCTNNSVRVKDLLNDENMTIEQLAKMLKNI